MPSVRGSGRQHCAGIYGWLLCEGGHAATAACQLNEPSVLTVPTFVVHVDL